MRVCANNICVFYQELLYLCCNLFLMCTDKIRIKSRSRTYRPLASQYYVDVPCGKCPSCVQGMQDDWFLRLWSEINKYNKLGGKCIFATLTYRKVPTFNYKDENGEIHRIPVFSNEHKVTFLNSIRKYYSRLGISQDTTKSGLGLRFMWACEYGMDDRFTHRPHYHIILFFPPEYCIHKTKTAWQRFIQHYWSHGWIRWSREDAGGIFVDSEFAAKYVSKYCTKQVEYYQQPELDKFLFNSDGTRNEEHFNLIKNFLPRHWQSKSFGLDLVQFCEDDKVFHDGLDLNFVQDKRAGKKHMYRVPRYIVRKLLYRVDEFGRLVLNERGIKYNRDYVSLNILDELSSLEQYTNTEYLNSKNIGRSFFDEISDLLDYWNFPVVYSVGELIHVLDDMRGDHPLTDLVYFRKFIQHRCIRLSDIDDLNIEFKKLDDGCINFEKFCMNFYDYMLSPYGSESEFYEDGFVKNDKNMLENMFFLDSLPRFRNFSLYLQCIDKLKDYLSRRRQDAYDIDRLQRKKLKFLVS